MTVANLDRLLHPKSIAVIGVSRSVGRQAAVGGAAVVNNLRRFGYPGVLAIVHPEAGEIAGIPAYASLAALPTVPDLVSAAVPATKLLDVVKECAGLGIRAMTIHTAGFAELGTDEGIRLEQELRQTALDAGIRICGPNGLGFVNVPERIFVGNFPSLDATTPIPGGLSIVTQSGAIGGSLLARATDRGVGLAYVISSGNETTVSLADYIDFLVDDVTTNAIALYLEGVADGLAFVRAARRAIAAGKPILVYKVGKSEAGARAALSHTAKVAGSATLYSGLFRQLGVTEVETLDDLLDIASLLIKTSSKVFSRPPKSAGIVTVSGGLGAISTDHLAQAGIAVPSLAAETQARLRDMAIPFASVANPVDTTAAIHHNEDDMDTVLHIVAADPGVDLIVAPNASRFPGAALKTAHRLDKIARALEKPLVSIWYAGTDNGEAMAQLRRSEAVASFEDHASCARALQALCRYVSIRARTGRATETPEQVSVPDWRPGVASEAEGKATLKAFGVPLLRESHVHSARDAIAAAERIGYPVALKIVSPDVAHKAAMGGVRLALATAADVAAAYGETAAAIAERAPNACLDGALVSEMVAIETELLVGLVNDATFGRALVVGAGGSLVEDINDVSLRLLPASRDDHEDMLDALHDRSLKARIAPHRARLVEILAKVETMIAAMPSLVEMDINPLAITRTGEIFALDSVMKFTGKEALDGQEPEAVQVGSDR